MPALKAEERKGTSATSPKRSTTSRRRKTAPKVVAKPVRTSPKNQTKTDQDRSTKPTALKNDDFLPEYHSQTNGLRELLSTIDPLDKGYQSPRPLAEPNLIEMPMHIPHSRPGIPGSPDLPVGPTRWGLYLSGVIGGLAFLMVAALAFSHLNSPTGINWEKLQAKAGDTYQWALKSLTTSKPQVITTARIAADDPLEGLLESKGTQVATASRISTTAASPQQNTIHTPTAGEIFISPEELENQIRAFEATSTGSPKQVPPPTRNPKKKLRAIATQPVEYQQLVVIPAANIDPDMESQIFKRARSYLKQRDISSARMILQYAATLGSGISAMALAETFDPNYLKKINLHGVSGSPTDARKWYNMAARLGITEANARITALK